MAFKKKKSKTKSDDAYDPYTNFVDENDDDAYESKKKELEKYSLKHKMQLFFKIHKKHEEVDEDDDHSSYQQSLMGSGSDDSDEDFKVKKDKSLLYKLRWYEWMAIVIDVFMFIYLILILFRIVPIF